MSASYRGALEEELPDVDIVFDRFHVMQLITTAMDQVRRAQQQKLEKEDRLEMKGKRFLMLRNYQDLCDKDRNRVDLTLEANTPIFIMHTMKELLRSLWTQRNAEQARRFLMAWITDAIELSWDYYHRSGQRVLAPLRRVAMTLAKHRTGILNFFKYHITNGRIEGINNKIKTLKRQAYGFRDLEYFKLRLYHLHQQKLRLAG